MYRIYKILCLVHTPATSLQQCNGVGTIPVSRNEPYNVTCDITETTRNVTWTFLSLLTGDTDVRRQRLPADLAQPGVEQLPQQGCPTSPSTDPTTPTPVWRSCGTSCPTTKRMARSCAAWMGGLRTAVTSSSASPLVRTASVV